MQYGPRDQLLQLLALPEVLPLPAAEELPPVLPVGPLGRVPATRSAHQVYELLARIQVPVAHPKCPVAQQSPDSQLAETEGAP